jgi:hypothetical protein
VDQADKRKPPEELELERKRAQLAALEPGLAEKELELATLRASLAEFERRYLSSVGLKYAELDKVEAEMYEAAAKLVPEDAEAKLKAQAGREQAKASAEAAKDARSASTAPPRQAFSPSDHLKTLYRSAAKALHPDLADGEADRQRRHQFMIRVNEAYSKGDEQKISAILTEWQHSPEYVKGDSVAAELVRMIRKLARGQERIRGIEEQMQKMKKGELFLLKIRVEKEEAGGRDLLDELASEVANEIREARKRLEQLENDPT